MAKRTTKKLYSFDDHPEHKDRLEEHRDKWIAIALRTTPQTDADRDACRVAVRGLYKAAKLDAPSREVFCASPIGAAIAAVVASCVWWLREHPEKHLELFCRRVAEAELMGAIGPAVEIAVRAAHGREVEVPTLPAATDVATRDVTAAATSAATVVATADVTDDATDDATAAATRVATDVATFDATNAATNVATVVATDVATRVTTRVTTADATRVATADGTDVSTRAATRDATATYAATADGTAAVTDVATAAAAAATFAATDVATRVATAAATFAATTAATSDATDAVTDVATRVATRGVTADVTAATTADETRAATVAATQVATAAAAAVTDVATAAATAAATADATRVATAYTTRVATADATRVATRVATADGTDVSTRAATVVATRVATVVATRVATDVATNVATNVATDVATDVATNVATADVTLSPIVAFYLRALPNWGSLRNGGNQWAGWCAYLSFFREVADLKLPEYSNWIHYEKAAIHGGPRFMHSRFWIVSDFPTRIGRDERNQPHSATGPAIAWSDGWAAYYWRGVKVTREWIESPSTVDPALALTHPNVEQRRCLAEILGWDRVLGQLNARTIDTDPESHIGELVEVEIEGECERFLRVVCGTGRRFAIPVPPETKTAIEAQAWMHDVSVDVIRKLEART